MIDKKLKYSELIFTGVFLGGIFGFFNFFYSSHLHFEEQARLFLFTGDYFISSVKYPGGFAGYSGEFLTQFWYLPVAGPVIITALMFAMQQLFRKVLARLNPNGSFFMLSFLPSLNCAMIICDEFYPLSAIMGMLIAIMAAVAYTRFKGTNERFIAGIFLLIITYFLAGGSFLSLFLMIAVYEAIIARRSALKTSGKGKKEAAEPALRLWHLGVYVLIVILVPLAVKQFFIMETLNLAYVTEFYYDLRTGVPVAIPVLFVLPSVTLIIMAFLPSKEKIYHRSIYFQYVLFAVIAFLGFRQWANFGAERAMRYDYLVRHERWDDVIKYAEKDPPRNNLSLAMLNLALAKTGRMGDMMFSFGQNGTGGLFIPFTREREYVAPMLGNEILYHLGLVNACQEYSFESMETIPDYSKSARHLKRLAETNLINGNYEVSRKYINILRETLFYNKWARETEKYLGNEEMINNHPSWGEKRKMQIRQDFFFRIENMESVLNMLIRDNPQNKMAFQYLMAFYLVNKDLRNVMNTVPKMKALGLERIPSSWEEAIMYVVGLSTTNIDKALPFNISQKTKDRMKAYAQVYTTNPNAKPVLLEKFPDTYWYYLHFRNVDLKNSK